METILIELRRLGEQISRTCSLFTKKILDIWPLQIAKSFLSHRKVRPTCDITLESRRNRGRALFMDHDEGSSSWFTSA